jgi:hypothetical protein
MRLEEFTKYIRKSGCRLKLYKNLDTVKGCAGYFEVNSKGPHISAAIRYLTPVYQMELVAHEYCHYLQYNDEKDLDLEEVDMCKIHEEWLAGKEFSDEIIKETRDLMLLHEWDADRRAMELSKKLNLEPWDMNAYIRGSQSYLMVMKWSWQTRQPFEATPSRWKFKPVIMTEEELLAPMSTDEVRKMNKMMRVKNILVPEDFPEHTTQV